MSVLLVVDDEPAVIALFTHIFRETNILIEGASTVREALAIIEECPPDAVMLDVVLPDGNGLDAFRQMHEANPQVPVVMMTAGGDSETAIQAMQMGAMDYLIKPLSVNELEKIVRRAIEVRRLMSESVKLEPEASSGSQSALIGRCAEMQKVYKSIGRVASQNISVLIRGESGTGKELVARAIFQFSPRKDKPFLAVNCAAIPDALLESELFGHEKGAFTGADRRRIGKFEQCHGGTLFLDEIGDMDAQLQSKLLRVLQEKNFQRVGGTETITADVRVVAATHRNLEQMCSQQKFREDLFYRLNGFTIQLPPLRERESDLELLVEFFLHHANEELSKKITRLEPAALEKLRNYPWPGNVRELQSVVRQAMVQSSGSILLADFFPDLSDEAVGNSSFSADYPLEEPVAIVPIPLPNHERPIVSRTDAAETVEQLIDRHRVANSTTLYEDVVDEVERKLIAVVLDESNGNQSEAAKRLGITRTTLRTKINKLGIGIRRVVDEG